MPEEEIKVGDSQDDLDKAYKETFGEEELKSSILEEEKKEDKEKIKEPVPEDHPTKLGRRVKGLETTLSEMNQKLDNFFSRFDARDRETIREETGLPEIISTPEDVIKVNRYMKKKEQEEEIKDKENFSRNYLNDFKSLGSRDSELYPEIYDEMIKNFNIRYSDDPKNDARVNYAEAKAALLSRKFAPVKPNIKGKKPEIPIDLGIESKETPISSESVHLDDFAQDFAKSTGMKEESIKEALKR